MPVDLWSPDLTVDDNGFKGYLMNSMCDITQFLISSLYTSIDSTSLAKKIISDVILTFGVCRIVVIDDGSSFKNIFIAMCFALKIHYWCLLEVNHQGNSVEHYHRFLIMAMIEVQIKYSLRM